MTKNNENKKIKKVKKRINPKIIIFFKILIIGFLIYGFYFINSSYSNSVSLLAVSENKEGEIKSGSIIKLNLEVKPGSGETYVNLNTIEEVDTQISIINSQKVACNLFELDCENYDFYYTFEGSALFLKGPSASSAIAILVAKTLNKEKLDNSTVITGSLNSGGIIGNVGGVDAKIETAQNSNFDKVLIPVFSNYNSSAKREIEVIKSIDIIEAYNEFNGKKFYLEEKEINNQNYQNHMKDLADMMCERTNDLEKEINFDLIKINSSEDQNKNNANNSINSSIISYEKENYYSVGSFCYNANINYRILIERQKNLSLEDIDKNLEDLEKEINLRYVNLISSDYKKNIKTINDFYVYLILIDRIEEAREQIDAAKELKLETIKLDDIKENETSKNFSSVLKIISEDKESIKLQKENLYSMAKERFYTVSLWENFIKGEGKKVNLAENKLDEACSKITGEISIKGELLNNYGFGFLNDEINKQKEFANPFSNEYLCIYRGLELNGRIDTILNSVGIDNLNQKNYTKDILDIAKARLLSGNNDNFPLIPYIYLEYSEDLFYQDDLASSMLYSNFALSYADLELYLEKDKISKPLFNETMQDLFSFNTISMIFLGAFFVLLAFL